MFDFNTYEINVNLIKELGELIYTIGQVNTYYLNKKLKGVKIITLD